MLVVRYFGKSPDYIDGFGKKLERSCKGAIHFLPGSIRRITQDEFDYIKEKFPHVPLRVLPVAKPAIVKLKKSDGKPADELVEKVDVKPTDELVEKVDVKPTDELVEKPADDLDLEPPKSDKKVKKPELPFLDDIKKRKK